MSRFPDPRFAPTDGPLAWGGDLRPETLIEAYREGIFPWPEEGGLVWWWSPHPRAVIPMGGLHISRSLGRTLRHGGLHCTSDVAFGEVVDGCAERPADGTWITDPLHAAYLELHRRGVAHSIEVWNRERHLVGGLFGIATGQSFCGESMFHRVSDASKVAMVATMRLLQRSGFLLFDVQLPTDHLMSMGAVVIGRTLFLDVLRSTRNHQVAWDATAVRGDLLPA